MDSEAKTMFIRIGLLALVTGFMIFFLIKLYANTYGTKDTKILKMIDNNKSVYLLITEKKCTTCNHTKEVLNNNNISYYELNKNRSNDYVKIVKKFNIDSKSITTPCIIHINNKEIQSIFLDYDAEELNEYINNLKEES